MVEWLKQIDNTKNEQIALLQLVLFDKKRTQ